MHLSERPELILCEHRALPLHFNVVALAVPRSVRVQLSRGNFLRSRPQRSLPRRVCLRELLRLRAGCMHIRITRRWVNVGPVRGGATGYCAAGSQYVPK